MNTFCVSYTTNRTHNATYGGNFVNASYGTYIPNRADQLVFWRAEDYHGTTLPVVDPEDEHPAVQTRGIGFVMSETFPKAYENYLEHKGNDTIGAGANEPKHVKTGVLLAATGTQPGPLKNLEKRAALKDGVQKPSKNSRVWGEKLPSNHAYHKWKNETLWQEVQRRRSEGKHIVGAKDWPKRDLQKALLVHDGVELEDGDDAIRRRYGSI